MSPSLKKQKIQEARISLALAQKAVMDTPRSDRKNPLWDTIDELQDIIAGLLTSVNGLVEALEAEDADGPDLDALTKLGELKASGILTSEEFDAQKARVLG